VSCNCRELCCALHLSRVWLDLGRLWSVLRQSDTCFRSDALRPDDPPTAALITIECPLHTYLETLVQCDMCCSLFAICYSQCTVRHSPFAIRHSPFAVRRSPFAIRHSPFTIRHSPFAIVRHPPLQLSSQPSLPLPSAFPTLPSPPSCRGFFRRCGYEWAHQSPLADCYSYHRKNIDTPKYHFIVIFV
jgi:hypothetical protein